MLSLSAIFYIVTEIVEMSENFIRYFPQFYFLFSRMGNKTKKAEGQKGLLLVSKIRIISKSFYLVKGKCERELLRILKYL